MRMPQPHTYAFHAIHASHVVATQRHERFKHSVQDLEEREANHTWVSPDPSLSWAPGLLGLRARERSLWQLFISEPANLWQESHPRAVMVNRTKANDEPAGGIWEAEHSGRAFRSNLALSDSGQNRRGHKTKTLSSISFSKTNPEFHPLRVCCYVAP